MQDILCRGKTPVDEYFNGGEWVTGHYTCFNGEEHRIYSGYAEKDCGDYYPDWCNVVPETVGRYTGMAAYWNDFENEPQEADVWEHDLLEVFYESKKIIAAVRFEAGMFILASYEFADNYIPLFDVVMCEGDDIWINAKVIGNIHDNPELVGRWC